MMIQIDDSWYKRPEGVPEGQTAGGVVVRKGADGLWIALAQEKIYHSYVLPKGHVETGESIVAAARREIAEEVGVSDLVLVEKLGVKTRLDCQKTEWKITHYFLYTTQQTDTHPTHVEQHETMHWLPIEPIPPFFWPEQRGLLIQHVDRIKWAVNRRQK